MAVDKKKAKQWVKAAGKVQKEDEKRAKAEAKKAEKAAEPSPDGDEEKPRIQIGGLTHDPEKFKKGEDVKSMVNVTNNGDSDVKLKLSLYVNEGLADATTVSVKSGKSKKASFKWTAQEKNKLNIRGELAK